VLFELAGQSHTRRCIAYAQLIERVQTGFYSHRRNHFEQFLAHAAVHGCTTESDAILSAVIELALAEIARMGAASSPVTNMELSATVAAAKKPNQQTLSGSNCRHRLVPLPVYGIAPRHLSVLFIGAPVYVTFMVVADEHTAVFGPTKGTLTPDAGPIRTRLHRTG